MLGPELRAFRDETDRQFREAVADLVRDVPGLTGRWLDEYGSAAQIGAVCWDDGVNGYYVSCTVTTDGPGLRPYTLLTVRHVPDPGTDSTVLDLKLTGPQATNPHLLAVMVMETLRQHAETIGHDWPA